MVEELWRGGPLIKDADSGFKLGTDSVLLADFANSSLLKKNRAADLGCGSGIISLLLAWNNPGLYVDGIEINNSAAQLAIENAKINRLDDRIAIFITDIRRHREFMQAGAYDMAVSNPPYYTSASGKPPSNPELINARVEQSCTLDDICKAACYITRWSGSLILVHKPECLADVFRSLNSAGFEPKRIRFVQHKRDSSPNLVLIESRKGGKPMLKVEAPLILADDDGSDSDEFTKIYRR